MRVGPALARMVVAVGLDDGSNAVRRRAVPFAVLLHLGLLGAAEAVDVLPCCVGADEGEFFRGNPDDFAVFVVELRDPFDKSPPKEIYRIRQSASCIQFRSRKVAERVKVDVVDDRGGEVDERLCCVSTDVIFPKFVLPVMMQLPREMSRPAG